MRKISEMIIIGILCLSAFSIFAPNVRADTSLIQNGGFEQGFVYWEFVYQPPAGSEYNLDNSVHHSGQYSAHASGYNCFMQQHLSIYDGTILFSFWTKGTGGVLSPDTHIETPGTIYYMEGWEFTPTSEWTYHSRECNITQYREEWNLHEGTVTICFAFQGPDAEVWIDDVEATIVAAPPLPPVPEFPLGFVLEAAFIPIIMYIWLKRKQRPQS